VTPFGLRARARTALYPHCLPASLCAGLAASNVVRVPSLFTALVAVGAAASAVLLVRESRLVAVLVALAALGLWWGSVRLQALDRSVLRAHVGRSGEAVVVATGPARRGLFSLRVPARVERFRDQPVSEPVLLELPLGRAPPQGTRLLARAELAEPRGPSDGFDQRAWLRRQGVHVVLKAGDWRAIGRRGGIASLSDGLRGWLEGSLAPGLEGERRSIIAGIVLGADEGLSADLRDRFRASGLYHLLAVSGQNVAFLAAGVLLCAWLLGVPRGPAELSILLAITAYVMAVGWQPSVVRAGVAGSLASLAWLASRPRDRWYFLLLGAAVLLAWNPYNLLEPGFQLSFAAVAAIFVAVPWLEDRLRGYPVPRRLASVIAVSAACGLATAPISWLHFGAVPLFSLPANALAAPVVAPLLGLGLLTAGMERVLPDAALALAWINGWLAAYLALCARLVGGLPYAQITSWQGLAGLGLVLGMGVAVARLRHPRLPRTAAIAAVAVLVLGGWRLWPESTQLPAPTGARFVFLDVGQGDATLIQVPEGAVLVDQGPPEADVARQLRRLGVHRLELLVLTHPSRDNIGGAEEVVRRLDVGLVLEPSLPFENPFGNAALAEARRRHIPVAVTRAGQVYRLGRLRLRVLWPEGEASPADDPNDHATVLLVSYGATDALLPADAESNVTLRLAPPPVELVKVGHHGSADEGLEALLRLVRPELAVISVGADNEYGHPTPSTLATLARQPGLASFRTDREGRVVVESDGRRLTVTEGG